MAISTRAHSRKNNVFVFRTFLSTVFPNVLSSQSSSTAPVRVAPPKVLDVAGGKGDLAWLLSNVRGEGELNDVAVFVIDPQQTNHSHLEKSVAYLVENKEEVRVGA